MFPFPVLIGDIGGTNARFAVLAEPDGPIELLPRARTAAAPDPAEAIRTALASSRCAPPRAAMIAVATRVDSLVIRMTNAPWTIDAAAIGTALGLSRVDLVNDYTPVAASLIALNAGRGDVVPLGGTSQQAGARAALGPGTGFGGSVLVPVEMSAPFGPTFCRGVTAACTATTAPSVEVSSTMTTASAPSGIGAPVAISTHVPGVTRTVGTSPVNTRPASFSVDQVEEAVHSQIDKHFEEMQKQGAQ